MEQGALTGTMDDQLNPPTVTPVPAPADDQLARLAVAAGVVAAIAGFFALRWLRHNVVVSRRR